MASYYEIGKAISRNSPVGAQLSMRDNYRQWLISKGATASPGANIKAVEKSFFAANGGTGRSHTELMGSFCAAKGFTGGLSPRDNWRRFLASGTV